MATKKKKKYVTPRIEEWSIAGITQVGQTIPGGDCLPNGSKGKEDGSIYPDGITC